jgi:hypothetical protein
MSARASQRNRQWGRARSGTGETFFDCKSRVTASTACLEAVLQIHEDVHHNECLADKKSLHLGMFDDRWKVKSLRDYATEDIAGYQAELDEALKRLRALPASCRPSGWIGTITAFQVKRVETSNFVKPNNKYADGTTEKSSNAISRWGTIHFSSQPTASWHVQVISSITTISGGLVGCKGGLKTMPADHHEVNTLYSEINGDGGHQKSPNVSLEFTDDKLYYTLSVEVPEVTAKVKKSGYNRSTGGCQPFDIPVPDMARVDSPIAAVGTIEMKGHTRPADNEISGSHEEDLIPVKLTVPGIDTNTDTVRFVWHLHRVDRP